MKFTLFIAALFLGLGCTSSPTNSTSGRTPNIPAPDFTHTSLGGEEFTLSDFRAKWSICFSMVQVVLIADPMVRLRKLPSINDLNQTLTL